MTGQKADLPFVITTYFEVKTADSNSDYPKVAIVGEFYVYRNGARDEIESICKGAIERRLTEAIAHNVVLEHDGEDEQ